MILSQECIVDQEVKNSAFGKLILFQAIKICTYNPMDNISIYFSKHKLSIIWKVYKPLFDGLDGARTTTHRTYGENINTIVFTGTTNPSHSNFVIKTNKACNFGQAPFSWDSG